MSAKWSIIDNVITYFNDNNLYQHEFDDDNDETYNLVTNDNDDVCYVYSQSTAIFYTFVDDEITEQCHFNFELIDSEKLLIKFFEQNGTTYIVNNFETNYLTVYDCNNWQQVLKTEPFTSGIVHDYEFTNDSITLKLYDDIEELYTTVSYKFKDLVNMKVQDVEHETLFGRVMTQDTELGV